MKRNLLPKSLQRGLLAVPAAAMMLGASHGAQIGINFQTDWLPQYNYGYSTTGFAVTGTAFDVSAASWFNLLPTRWDTPTSTTQAIATANGPLNLKWSCANAWGSGIGNIAADPADPGVVAPGNDEVTWSYLDDSSSGYFVTISGLRGIASDYTIQTIAATDGGNSFVDVNLTTNNVVVTTLNYTSDPAQITLVGGAAWATSTVSTAFATLTGNDSVTIHGLPRAGSSRSTLAGIILTYTPGNNPPLIEVNPQAPTGQVFIGSSFALSALASGSPTLHYQWRKDGADILGATSTSYTNASAGLGDTGDYDVVVTNAYPSYAVTSAVAHVTVVNVTTPTITKGPVSQSLYQGYPVSFSVEATGGQLNYQWKSNGVAVAGATNTTFSLINITSNYAGIYSVAVSNPVGPAANASANLTVKVPTPGSYEAVVAQTKPLIWFRDSETEVPLVVTGTAANSGSTGAPDNGVAKFYTTFQQPGAIVNDTNMSASFNGGQAIDVPFDAALNTASFTVELWAKPTAVDGAGAQSPLYNRGASGGDGWLFWANNATTSWQFRTYEGTTRTTVNSTGAALPGVWTHLVGVYDGTTTHLYVNGVEQGSGTAAGYVANSSIPLRIGAAGNDTGAAGLNAWNGGVDEVALYNTVLTPAEILSHYQNGTNATRTTSYATLVQASTPVGYWRLNDPSAPTAPSPANSGILGAAWNGSYGGDILPGTDGPLPPSYPGFESTNHAVSMTAGWTTAPQLPLATNTVTVTCWIKRAEVFSTGDLSWPAWLGGGGMHLNLTTSTTPGELRYHWNGNNWDWSSGLFVPADVWTFCAMVIEPTKATFYMSSGSNLLSSVDDSAHAPMVVTSPPGFGGNQPANAGRNYIGQLDESTVYNRALTQSEITTLFMVGTGAPLQLNIVPGGIIEDSKPVGTPQNGANYLTTWLASSPGTPVSRTGVEQFLAATNSQITVPANTEFDSTTGTFTFWVRVPVATIPGPGNEGAVLMDRRTDNGTIIVLNDAGNILVQCAAGANSLTSAANLVDDNWHLVAVTYNQANGAAIEIYIDGTLSASQANSSAWSWPVTAPVEIGRSHDAYWKRYDGLMDDFRIYNRVLTQSEIATIFASDALVDTAVLKLRFNFSTAGIGKSVTWPFGTLLSSPVLDPSAIWTPVPGAVAPTYPFMPTEAGRFFRATP